MGPRSNDGIGRQRASPKGRAMQHEPPLGRGKTVAASLLFGLVLFVTYNACESALGRIGRQTLVSRNGLEPVLGKGDRLLVRRQSEYRRGDIVVQQELGRDARTFHDALMHFLRLDPDVICAHHERGPDRGAHPDRHPAG